jgi:hypothetical protein
VGLGAAALASVLALAAAPNAPAPRRGAPSRAPNSPPLSTGQEGAQALDGEEGAGATPGTQADPLVSNGLGSPTCRGALAGGLSRPSRRNCETSGFVAAAAPTGDYGIDVHIDTGVLGVTVTSVVQDMIVTPLWMALVWAVHALVVMLEWCFTIDLLDSAAASGLGPGLRRMQAAFTEPWLPIALAAASVLVLYHGLIRRRVAQSLGEALLMGAMMVAGMWAIADPTGTVGALGAWANQASLGTLAVADRGSPAAPRRALASSMGSLFAAAIEAPWCYMEFGDVDWCRDAARLDARLRAAALKLAAQESAEVGCQPGPAAPAPCWSAGSPQASALESSATLLRDARSNGAIFLALPANGPARNSINEPGSLLRTLCQSSDATDCSGPTAAQAEFRTGDGTWSRLGGLLLIAAGVLGILLLLGFVALRLLAAAVFSLLYLLLAPAMVLAPAFGEGGRALFRRWGAQLLGAVVSKLLFAFLLGVVLAILAILARLQALGWWTQWLLSSAFWWGAYLRRHQALGVAGSALGREVVQQRSVLRRMGDLLESRKGMALARWARDKRSRGAPDARERRRERTSMPARLGRERARAHGDEQVSRTLEAERREASERAGAAALAQGELAAKRARLERLRAERFEALAHGDTRRAASLGGRERRVRGELARERDALQAAQRAVRESERAQRRTGSPHTPERREAHERFLDAQAALPAAGRRRATGERRDYAALAGLAGYGGEEYERLDPRRRRAARLEIDRELAMREELRQAADALGAGEATERVRRRERRAADRKFDRVLQRRMQDAGHGTPASREPRSGIEQWRQDGRAERANGSPRPHAGAGESSVMRDAHEVAARRKRQLGRDRP